MPFGLKDAKRHKKGMNPAEKKQWVSVANSVLEECINSGGNDRTCAPKAIMQANGVINKRRKKAKENAMAVKTLEVETKKIEEEIPTSEAELGELDGIVDSFEGIEDETVDEGYTDHEGVYRDFGATTFAQLKASEEADETAKELRILTEQFTTLVSNIMFSSEVTDKAAGIRAITDEFVGLIDEVLGEVESDPNEVEFSESFEGVIVNLIEDEDQAYYSRAPLKLDVVLIKPGFGNKKDNHYYPAAMLKRDAKVFEGVKMYATDHKQDEKSVKTEVSKVDKIVGFTDDGAPIGRVIVFDPAFAEMTRNRAKSGALKSLECSILAMGSAKKGKVNGKVAKVVEAITAATSVDWVTRAGAGGHALHIAESESEENEVNRMEKLIIELEVAELPEDLDTETLAGILAPTFGEGLTVAIAESETEEPEEEETEEDPPAEDEEPETEEEDEPISKAEVGEIVDASRLPKPAKVRLMERDYQDAEEVETAVTAEIEYLKTITGSGKPVGKSGKKRSTKNATTFEEVQGRQDDVLRKYGFIQRPVAE